MLKESWAAFIGLSLMDRRKRVQTVAVERRRITRKRADEMLQRSIERLENAVRERK
jgi:hypothetical protein